MLRQSLKRVSLKLIKITSNSQLFSSSHELKDFLNNILSLHESIKVFLRLRSLPCEKISERDLEVENNISKSVRIPLKDNINNEEEYQCQSTEFTKVKSFNQSEPTKYLNPKKMKLTSLGIEDKNFQELMENIKIIIKYQNKVENLLKQINNQQSMTQVCQNQNILNLPNHTSEIDDSKVKSFVFQCIKTNIQNVIQQCKEIQEEIKQFKANQSIQKLNSESEGIDKKSLLTEMLRESQILENQNQDGKSPKKANKRPMSQLNCLPQSNKRLLKQIDFSSYRIEGSQRRQKKVKPSNCGQCSQCTIF